MKRQALRTDYGLSGRWLIGEPTRRAPTSSTVGESSGGPWAGQYDSL